MKITLKIPINFYKEFTFSNGKPYYLAITLLAYIRSQWPNIIVDYDLKTGLSSTYFVTTYQTLSELFQQSKYCVREALEHLCDKGIISKFHTASYDGTLEIKLNVYIYERLSRGVK